MPEETGMLGYGSTVRVGRIGVDDVINWVELALLGDIEAPNEQVDEVETTHQKSPGRRKQFIAGLTDSGEVAVPHNYIPGSETHLLLSAIKGTGEQVLIEFTLSEEGDPETFSGFLKGYARTAPISGKMAATATFRLSEVVVP